MWLTIVDSTKDVSLTPGRTCGGRAAPWVGQGAAKVAYGHTECRHRHPDRLLAESMQLSHKIG